MLCTDINTTETAYSCFNMYLVINKWVIAVKVSNLSGQYLRNHWTLDIGVLGYIVIVWPKEHSPEVWSVPPVTPCIWTLHQILYGGRRITSCGWEWMNFSPVAGCPITKIFPNEYFCSFINFNGLLSFVFCVSFLFISYLYSALSLKMMMKARNVHCWFQRVLKPHLHPARKDSCNDCWNSTFLVCVSCTQRTWYGVWQAICRSGSKEFVIGHWYRLAQWIPFV